MHTYHNCLPKHGLPSIILQYQFLVKPDFIIIGAMKSGTTTLHEVLEQHPDVYMPRGEMKFFSIDDFEQQHYFFPYHKGQWTDHDFRKKFELYKKWYIDSYANAGNAKVIGEDAPSYLPSKRAPERIAEQFPDIKLIISLRDPVSRLYSQYWHNVNNFGAYFTLEETLRYHPGLYFDRSCYKRQIENYLKWFPKEQMLFILFEELILKPTNTIRAIEKFIGLPEFDYKYVHANQGHFPKSLKLRLFRNRVLKSLHARHYYDVLPGMPRKPELTLLQKFAFKAEKAINSAHNGRKPQMEDGTYTFLKNLLYRENEGLEEIIGKDLREYWPTFQINS